MFSRAKICGRKYKGHRPDVLDEWPGAGVAGWGWGGEDEVAEAGRGWEAFPSGLLRSWD